MENIFINIGIAIVTFALTNIDDLLLLSFYFSNPNYKSKQIVFGQYAGIFVLIFISLLAALAGKELNPKWIGLLGFVPIIIGIKNLWILFNKKEENKIRVEKKPVSFAGIALITIANGGDNIGVYTPLFANSSYKIITLYLLVFSIMIGIWCALGYYFVKHPLIKNVFAKYSTRLLPFFLIGLGIAVLKKTEFLHFLFE